MLCYMRVSEWMAWGALRPSGNVPSRHLFPPPFSSSRRSGKIPSIQAGKSATRTSMGWIWALGKTAHFAGTEALPHVIPHTGTKLGALAQRKGLGCRVAEPNTHTRTGSKTKGKKHAQLIPCWLRRLKQYSLGVWGSA